MADMPGDGLRHLGAPVPRRGDGPGLEQMHHGLCVHHELHVQRQTDEKVLQPAH